MKGKPSFEELQSDDQICEFFEEQFGDAVPYLDNLVSEFKENPVGKLGTLTCSPWIYKDKVALIGDAAHAIVPFYGQGMNASFEDCRILDQCIGASSSISEAFALYYDAKKKMVMRSEHLLLKTFTRCVIMWLIRFFAANER